MWVQSIGCEIGRLLGQTLVQYRNSSVAVKLDDAALSKCHAKKSRAQPKAVQKVVPDFFIWTTSRARVIPHHQLGPKILVDFQTLIYCPKLMPIYKLSYEKKELWCDPQPSRRLQDSLEIPKP